MAVDIFVSDLDGEGRGGIPDPMSNIDKQRIADVTPLWTWGTCASNRNGLHPIGRTAPATAEADAMHALLVPRADQLEGSEDSPEDAELMAIADAQRLSSSLTPSREGDRIRAKPRSQE